LRSELANVSATIGGIPVIVDYAGNQNFYVGVDQINLRLPKSLIGKGDADVNLLIDGKGTNAVKVNFK
jgi:uncharacterized protein (TIGR03437 family)